MKKEELCECGHHELQHHSDWCGMLNCSCKKFKPSQGMTQEVPQNHSPQDVSTGNTGKSDSEKNLYLSNHHPEYKKGFLDGYNKALKKVGYFNSPKDKEPEGTGHKECTSSGSDNQEKLKEESLSDKRKRLLKYLEEQFGENSMIPKDIVRIVEEQDKEFISKLKEWFVEEGQYPGGFIWDKIDEIFGKELI